MKYDLFISDFDGTLGKIPDIIEEETVSAIKEYTKKGGIFVVCTGRMLFSIRNICLKYGLEGLVVSYQGAMINDIKTGKEIFSGGMEKNLAKEVVSSLEGCGIEPNVDIGLKRYYKKQSVLTEVYEKLTKTYGEIEEDLFKVIDNAQSPVLKITGLSNAENIKINTPLLKEKFNGRLIVNNGAEEIVEFVVPSLSKGAAVERISAYYKIPLDRVLTVGDSSNDKSLVEGPWHGVAVGDGKEELKAVAKEITVPYADKPVKYLLEKYCL